MKKILIMLLLTTATIRVMAQKKSDFLGDSLLNNKLTFKMDTSLFSNKALITQLFKGNNLTLPLPDKSQPFTSGYLNNNERLIYSKVDHMPILNTAGKSKMPVLKLHGNSKMPVVGKSDEENEQGIIDGKP